jgi:hypothetical protein
LEQIVRVVFGHPNRLNRRNGGRRLFDCAQDKPATQQQEPTLSMAKESSKAKFFADWLPIAFSAPFLLTPQSKPN